MRRLLCAVVVAFVGVVLFVVLSMVAVGCVGVVVVPLDRGGSVTGSDAVREPLYERRAPAPLREVPRVPRRAPSSVDTSAPVGSGSHVQLDLFRDADLLERPGGPPSGEPESP